MREKEIDTWDGGKGTWGGQAHVGGVVIQEPVAEATRPLPVVEGKGKEIETEEQVAQSLLALHTPKKKIHETPSPADAETSADMDKARSEPGKTPESRPPPKGDKMDEDHAGSDLGKSHVALAGSNTEPMYYDFVAIVYLEVHKSLKFPTDEQRAARADMKEILHQRMFESGSYKSLLEHVALYEDLEASIEWANWGEFHAKKDKSRKRRRDDQDLLPPPPNSDLTPSSSSKQQSAPHLDQPVEDVPMPDDVNISDSEDIDTAHLSKIKTRPDWLKPLPEEDRPETLELDWIIPPTDLPDAENNWADALAKSYKDPKENKLLRKTRDMRSFIKWFCKRIGKKKLSKSDLEGPTFKVVKS
nr:hypothetical protein [Tanacetum cinerariifolium]